MVGKRWYFHALFGVFLAGWLLSFVSLEGAWAQGGSRYHTRPTLDAGLPPVRLPASLKVTARISVKPKTFRDVCPASFVFTGEIKANRSATVEYRFVRSDGSVSPTSTLSFFGPESRTVTDTWQGGGESMPSYEGWAFIEIISPVYAESRKASFRLECRGIK